MPRMTLDQLQVFLAVAECLHFTRAGELLYLSQSAVSAAIQSLEDEYGVKLFHRIGRHIEITEAGKLLKQESQKIIDQVALTEQGLRELNNLQKGELKLGASLTIGNYWLPQFIGQFKYCYPGIQVNCTLGNTQLIIDGTAKGIFDLGLVEGKIKPADANVLGHQIVGSDRLIIVVGKSHPWFERREISLEEILTTGWVMRELGSGTRQQFEQALQRWGIESSKLNIILEMSSGQMVKAVVESGVGAAALSELMVEKEIKLGVLRPIAVTGYQEGWIATVDVMRPFLMLKHKQRFQTRISQVFEKLLIDKEETYCI